MRYRVEPTPTPTPTPAPAPGAPLPPAVTPYPTADAPGAVETAVAKWNSHTSKTSVTFCEDGSCGTSNTDGSLVTVRIIEGSASSNLIDGNHENDCGWSVACVKFRSSNHPHRGDQTLIIEDAAYESGTRKRWTNDFVKSSMPNFFYLPGYFMHEFAHTAGLGHSPASSDILGNADMEYLSSDDTEAMKSNYAGHTSHR